VRVSVRPDDLAVLTDEDKSAIQAIYRHRCLDENQLARYLYDGLDDGVNGYVLERLRVLIEAGFLKMREYEEGRKHVFVLTNLGVQLVRDLSDRPLYRVRKSGKRRNYEATAGELLIPDNLMDHQTQLNTLSLEIVKRCGLDPDCYKDSKFASNFTYAQPDGVLVLPKFDIFLEMDMGHERGAALRAKWNHYRTYFNSRDYYIRRNKPIIVLFAIEQVQRLGARRITVVRSINQEILDLIGPDFDCYIGSNEELYGIAERIIKRQKNNQFHDTCLYLRDRLGFRFSRPEILRNIWKEPCLYMRLPNSDGRPQVLNGRHQEFIVENGLDRRVNTLKKAVFFGQTLLDIKKKAGRGVPMLIVVPGEREIKYDMSAVDALGVPDVYFTTPKRLSGGKPLHEALFQFDSKGRRYHFSDLSLCSQIHEKL